MPRLPGGNTDPTAASTARGSCSALQRAAAIARSPLGNQLFGVLGGIAILFLLQAIYVASMKASGRAVARPGPETVGPAAIADRNLRATRQDAGFEPAPRLLQGMR
jgi:hypothetical protein